MAQWSRVLTRADLAGLYRQAGIRPGMDVMVHAALKGLGYLVNGPHDAIGGLLDVLGPQGTLLAPGHSGQMTDPAEWSNPPVPPAWQDIIRAEMEPFHPGRTPIRNRGKFPETLLAYPETRRSNHPIGSILALGARAEEFTAAHPLHEMIGVGSPCHKLYLAGGHVLLMNVGMAACTALHLAEFLAGDRFVTARKVTVLVDDEQGRRFQRLAKYPGLATHFERLRPELKELGALTEFFLDDYRFTLIAVRPAVDCAIRRLRADPDYFEGNRTP